MRGMKIASNIMKAVNLCLVASRHPLLRSAGDWMDPDSDLFRRLGTYSWGEGYMTQGRMGGGTGFLSKSRWLGAVQLR
jgi:hypothetical protein